jgi:adenylate kinase family enzyme
LSENADVIANPRTRPENFGDCFVAKNAPRNDTVGSRIAVVGATGSGKTMLAKQIAQRLGYRHIEMDSLHWEPNWTEAPLDIFRARVEQALTGDGWVSDGNYSKVRDIVWGRADALVWIDYSLATIFWRLGLRTIRRIVTREKLWGTNQEDWRAIFGRESLFLWVLQSRPRHHRDYPRLLTQPAYSHLKLIRLRSPRETDKWLKEI